MTKIKFFKSQDNYTGFECCGHTHYRRSGNDILCASLSGMTQSCMIGLTNVLNIKIDVKRNDDEGYLKIELPKNLDGNKTKDAQILLDTLYVSIIDLMEGYSKYISMEVIENDY